MLTRPYHKGFNFSHVKDKLVRLPVPEEAYALSTPDQILNNVMNMQINDGGWFKGHFSLRQSYDLLLLASEAAPLQAITNHRRWFRRLNTGLARSATLLGYPPEITFQNDRATRLFVKKFLAEITGRPAARLYRSAARLIHLMIHYVSVLLLAPFRSEARRLIAGKIRKLKHGEEEA
jgi:hypothetical protein